MRIVTALGGNALIKAGQKGSSEEQIENVKNSIAGITNLMEQGHELIITHGNGPQAGARLIRNEMAQDELPPDPLVVCVADTQGSMGYMIEQGLINNLVAVGRNPSVATLVTQIEVDRNDPAFQNPTKPVGVFYNEEEAEIKMKNGWQMVEDSGRGYRRVVPSPIPLKLVNSESLKTLLDSGFTVITGGGGGIPVCRNENNELEGIDAVIDKDLASTMIAKTVEADMLVILTAVEKVAVGFRSENPKWLDKMTVKEAEAYLAEGEFPEGSMGPKIKAAIDFASHDIGKKVIITSEDKLIEALNGETGTTIVK